MLKKILVVLVAAVGAIMAAAMAQPAEYHVERSTEIQAPAELVWVQISDFKQWKGWNAWEKCDPNQKVTIEGLAGTVGHKSSWQGEKTGEVA